MVNFGDIVIYGKIWKHTKSEPLKIHYIVYNQKGPGKQPGFGAAALELGLFGWGTSTDKAKTNLFEHIDSYLNSAKNKEEIFEILGIHSVETLWSLYRQLMYLYGDPELKRITEITKENNELKESHIEKDEKISELKIDKRILEEQINEFKKETVR
ncbi:hypothetical protein [Leptospira noguchii]|uniref:hypothetical protein n=1 Tax=Leptospira noguchii TaxID=28182 RepID=UPI0002BEDDCE|nr:hypothetical protein [Leptospira noguchii]EMO28836.1 hypothetical protein LEP1GSC170_2978 [Leptospira interrogans serovar Bataviae str. HAI135]EMS89554.1 hypothetical protein LEP1GSC074_1127 [Leptospira noguchii str. Hook]